MSKDTGNGNGGNDGDNGDDELKKAVEYLGLPMTEDGRVQLRAHARFVKDIVKIARFVRAQGFDSIRFSEASNVNLTWWGRRDQSGEDRAVSGVTLFTLGPKLSGETDLHWKLAMESGFLEAHKFVRAYGACRIAQSAGVPCPDFRQMGFDPALSRAYCEQEVARGMLLSDAREEMSREEYLLLMEQIGETIALLHEPDPQIDISELTDSTSIASAFAWHRRRISLACDWLQENGCFSSVFVGEIKTAVEKLIERLPDADLSLLHTDWTDHNIFVRQGEDGWHVSDVIDWETMVEAGDPRYDAVLAAWWLADEHKGDSQIFAAVLRGYNRRASPLRKIFPDQVDGLLMLADLVWYVNVLPFTKLRENDRFEKRKNSIKEILELLREPDPRYLPEQWQDAINSI